MAAAARDTAATQSPSPSEAKLNTATSSVATAASELVDFPHYKELQRNLRNNVKKLNATAKVDAIIAENPNKELEELVAEKKINNDQMAQALKKPALRAAIAQLEEQIAHYKEFATFYEQRLASQKAELEKAHKEEVKALQVKAAAASAPPEMPEVKKEDFTQQLLSVSKFLCTAAVRRLHGDETLPESRAFEGVLTQVYAGTLDAVAAMQKLIDGADEKILSVEGETLDVTYAKVKQLSEPSAEEPADAAEAAPATDPTTANAAYTELQDPAYAAQAAATEPAAAASEADNAAPPPQTLVGEGANAVAESTWEPHNDPLASSTNTEGFVEVPRDPAETETGLQATPANITADADVASQENAAAPKPENGFEPVGHRHQRQGSVRGRGRGRGRGGDGFRGRGRGDFRGRGRGRGGRGRGGPNGAPAAPAITPSQ
ncbi:uncharacterized protein BDV17DRAFT_264621 [Aspergillus undulatus]|uniref:uncharacterized protein n=1 Tax=Aspergillus undulatus TaxID=1810928 RepID=UPI003CCD4078